MGICRSVIFGGFIDVGKRIGPLQAVLTRKSRFLARTYDRTSSEIYMVRGEAGSRVSLCMVVPNIDPEGKKRI